MSNTHNASRGGSRSRPGGRERTGDKRDFRRVVAWLSGVTAAAALAPSGALALPTCDDLGIYPAYGLVDNPEVRNLSVQVTPAQGNSLAYCNVNFTFSSESGPNDGYRPAQDEAIRIRVGLPLNSFDGGTGGVEGAWNGRNRDNGGGGYAGSVGGVTSATNLGYVGTSTDTGHNSSEQPGGSFGLNPDNTLNLGQIRDFARDGILQQHLWGEKLARTYYGMKPRYMYWVGCSTGGRQGHYLAQNFPRAYDGILAGAPAFNWDRFIPSELWPQIVMNEELGGPIAPAKLNAVSAAAIQACDAIDGVTDGMLTDPRKCGYDANSFVCSGGAGDPANCLTAEEASAVNKIWEGPVASPENGGNGRAWYGLERGTPLSLAMFPFSISSDHFAYWIKQDPDFDWRTVTQESFFEDFQTSVEKFNDVIGTDDDLRGFRNAAGKMITYHGLFDNLIFPRGTYNYYNRVTGSNRNKQKFYRFFPYPNAGHCGGAGLNSGDLFTALVDWVENGVAPDHVVAQVNSTRTRKVCKYPDVPVYDGSGNTDDHNSFSCQLRKNDDPGLLAQDELDPRFEPVLQDREHD